MSYCRCECAYLAIIVSIILGVILGVLSSFGLVSTGIIFWVYLAIGVLGILVSPLYAGTNGTGCVERCYCNNRRFLLVAAVGAIIAAAVGLIVAPIVSVTVLAIVVGVASFFAALVLGAIICISKCICND